jgi:hypothetical protein
MFIMKRQSEIMAKENTYILSVGVMRDKKLKLRDPPRDDKGLRDFYHNWTNSILQQLKRNFWKIADVLFRIS